MCSLLFVVVRCLLLLAFRLVFVVPCLFQAVCLRCLSSDVLVCLVRCCLLIVVCCLLCVPCCWLFVVCARVVLVFGGWWLWVVVC